jgi:peptidoglycan DL-endopeptidase CwlO
MVRPSLVAARCPVGALVGALVGGSVALASVALLGCSASVSPRGASAPATEDPIEAREASAVMDFAWAQVGKRYCWGGTGPSCFDCSGLVQRAWGRVGVRLPRTADAIASELPEVPLSREGNETRSLRAGDILWWPGHVGLYAGNGWVVEALDRRHGVIRRPILRPPHRAFRPSLEAAIAPG